MLKISKPFRGRAQAKYYIQQEYLDNSKREHLVGPGEWTTAGAVALGLLGDVFPMALEKVLRGLDPRTEKALVKNADSPNRQSAWDLVYTAPKSVSVYLALADPETRRKILDAHRKAVRAANKFLEDNYAFSRKGPGGKEVVRTRLVAAVFTHTKSRANDPHLHSHICLVNLGVREDGSVGAILSRPIFESMMLAGSIYKAELAAQITQNLGLKIVATKNGFELSDVPPALMASFSKRAAQMNEQATGHVSTKAKNIIALKTRPAKSVTLDEDAQFEAWAAEAQAHGWSREQASQLQGASFVSEEEMAGLARLCRDQDDLQEKARHFHGGRDYAAIEAILAEQKERKEEVANGEATRPGRPISLDESIERSVEGLRRNGGRTKEKTFSITTPSHKALLDLISRVAKYGGIVTHVYEKKLFPSAPRWNPASKLTRATLAIGRYQWRDTHWRVWVAPKMRLEMRDRYLFSKAPSWSPVRSIKLPVLTISQSH